MAQSENGYELYTVCQAVSIGSKPYKGDADKPDPNGLRNITIMDQPGTSEDPYGGHKQREILANVEVSNVPDGKQLADEDCPAYGYDNDRLVAIYVKGSNPQVVTVAWHNDGDI